MPFLPPNQQHQSTKKWKNEKVNMDMLRSNSKQPGEYVQSVPKKKRKAVVERICKKVSSLE